jgi:hypothetical protein
MHPNTTNSTEKNELEAEVLSFTEGQALDYHNMG